MPSFRVIVQVSGGCLGDDFQGELHGSPIFFSAMHVTVTHLIVIMIIIIIIIIIIIPEVFRRFYSGVGYRAMSLWQTQ